MPVDDAEQHVVHDPEAEAAPGGGGDGDGGGEAGEAPPDDGDAHQFVEVLDTGGQVEPRTKLTNRPEEFDEDVRHEIAYTFLYII